jgi:hypothetical protein
MMRPGLPSLATLAAAALLAATPALADPPSHAPAWGHPSRQAYGDRDYDRYGGRYDDDRYEHRHDRDCDHDDRYRDRYRTRYHDRYDPVREVYVVARLPRGYRHVEYRGQRYYYHRDGHWYRPYGAVYAQVAPPAGLVIDSRGIAVVANVPIVRW